MKLNLGLKFIFSLLSALLLSGCLPEQKTTQCGKDEAFNATRRKCVPVMGAATSNTVFINSKYPSNNYTTSVSSSSTQHGVAVSDVYNMGYSIKWLVHYGSGSSHSSSLVATDTLTYTFHPAMSLGAGSYILEAIVYNESNGATLDSYSWSISVVGHETPTLVNANPNSASFSYPSNQNSATLSVDLNNPDGLSGRAYWVVNGSTTQVPNFNGSTTSYSTTINPQALGVGIHTVEMKITHATSSSNIYDSKVWIINVVNPDFPRLSNSPVPGFNHTIIAVNGQELDDPNGGFFYDHDGDGTTALENLHTKPSTGGDPGICISVQDTWDEDGDSLPDIYLVFDINGAQVGPQFPLTANTFCLDETHLEAQNLVNSEVGVSKVLTVSTYESGTASLIEQRSWAMNVIPQNSAPIIQISPNSAPSLGCAGGALHKTGCSATQSVDNSLTGTYTGAGDVDNRVKLAFDVLQDFETDYDDGTTAHGEDKNTVYFQIKKAADAGFQDIDGGSAYTKADCVVGQVDKAAVIDASTSTGAIRTYFCDLSFDAFSNGPIESGDYEVKAYMTDAGSVWGGTSKESNSVRWEITVNEYQSAPEIQPQTFASAVPAANESFFTSVSDGAGCSSSGTVLYNSPGFGASEGDYVVLHTFVKDLERDDLRVSVEMENLVSGVGHYNEVYGIETIARTTDEEYFEVQTCFQVPEWAVTAGEQAAKVVITVRDRPDNVLSSIPTNNISFPFQLNVTNVNPPPTFADYTAPENVDDLNGAYVLSGNPFTIVPPSYSDASVSNGDVVSWKWQVCVGDPGDSNECAEDGLLWEHIPNADSDQISETLVWTPSIGLASGSNVNLRMCLGDDGDGNPDDCSGAPESRKTYTNITANPSSIRSPASIANEPDGTELASWYDDRNDLQYLAYASGSDVFVEKLENDGNGAWSKIHSISFPADISLTENPHELSMTGVTTDDEEALIIAYKIFDDGDPLIRVRRIDLSKDKLSFNYTGVYDPAEGGDEDMLVGNGASADTLTNASFSPGANGALSVGFTGAATNGESITFRLRDGGPTVPLIYGTDWCAVACTASSAASELAAAINGHPRLGQEFLAEPSGVNVVVSGPEATDYVDDNTRLAISLGDVLIKDNQWYLPFVDGSNGQRASLLVGGSPEGNLANANPSRITLTTRNNLTKVKAVRQGTGLALATVSDGDLHAYLLDAADTISQTNENVFADAMMVKDISLDVNSDDWSFVAAISENASSETYLSAAVFDANLALVSKNIRFLPGTNNHLAESGIDKVSIVTREPTGNTAGAIIALTTSGSHLSIPNQAHLLEISQSTSDLTDNIEFHNYHTASSLSSPNLNLNPVLNGAAIALSPILPLTKGHSDESFVPGTEDNQQEAVLFTFHELNAGGPANEIRTGIYNVNSNTQITTDDKASGSYPAFISN